MVRTATCGKCGAIGLEWAESPFGTAYLRDRATSAEHWRTCGGVAPELRAQVAAPGINGRNMARAISTAELARQGYATPSPLAPVAVLDFPTAAAPVAELDEAPDVPDELGAELTADELAELDEAELYREAEAHELRRNGAGIEWPELRREILRQGGIGPSPTWPDGKVEWPADLYRAHGKAPDLVAAETMLGTSDTPPWGIADGRGVGDSEMHTYLWRAWQEWQRAQEARRPARARRAAPAKTPALVATAPREALAAPAPATERELVLDVARLVADVAELAASDPARYAAMARKVAELAAELPR